jgi:hypothetical protein
MELEAALAANRRVVPVLLDGGETTLASLPASLQSLRYRTGATVSRSRFDEDSETLASGILRLLTAEPERSAPVDPEDPQKGRWGGHSSAGGRTLRAFVTPVSDDWFEIALEVARSSGPPLTGAIEFHLHPSFSPAVQSVPAESDRAELRVSAWGAFTVGASADGGATRLELDLSELPDAPLKFRDR